MILLAFLIGCCVGGFLLVVAERLPAGESFTFTRSRCSACKKVLSPKELIPIVSYAWQRRRCRHCEIQLSFWYPLAELLTGICFALLAWHASPLLSFTDAAILFFNLTISSVLLCLFFIDARTQTLPDRLLIPTILLALFGSIFLTHTVVSALLGGIALASFFLLQYLLSNGRAVGDGDILLATLIGLFVGWPNALLAVWLAYVLGAMFYLPKLLRKNVSRKDRVAFGPFLVTGCFITHLFGTSILRFFFG